MKKKILVIEDDELLNSGLCYNIQKHDMTPYSAYGVEDARSSLRAETFDLILLDVNLPDGSGFDLAKEILLEKIWDAKEHYVNEHTLSLNVSRLRNKIADQEHEYIKTIYGLGYKWIGESR